MIRDAPYDSGCRFPNGHKLLFLALIAGVSLSSTRVEAMPEISRLEIKAPLRHDTRLAHAEGELTKNRLQYQVSFHYNFGLVQWNDWGALSLRGLAGTGGSYTSQWSTIYDFKKKETGQQLFNMRQIYFAWNLDRWRLDLGVIAPVKGKVSNTSLDKDGWIRGARFMVPFLESGSLEFVSGILDAIDDVRQPDSAQQQRSAQRTAQSTAVPRTYMCCAPIRYLMQSGSRSIF